jgi:DNA polymerase-3 subunit gamma/tau
MLSNAAFNARLTTLEEPPPHVKFIFATTEANKILPTILSRCQRFDLRPIPAATIADHLGHIARNEGIQLDAAAAWAIAKGADGGMRDAQSMLDQLVAFCGEHITEQNVLDVFGFTSREKVAALASALLRRDPPAALSLIQKEAADGRELSQLLGELIGCLRALLVAKLDPAADGEGIPADLWAGLLELCSAVPSDRILASIDVFAEAEGRMKWATNKRLHFELGVIKAIQTLAEVRINDLIDLLTRSADSISNAPTASAAADISPTAATASPTRPRPKKPSLDDLDSLIDSAPESSDPPPRPPSAVRQEPAPAAPPAVQPPEPPALNDDPLIQAAIAKFKGKVVAG